MPFGFPPLKQEEYNIIAGWLAQGAHGPTDEEQQLLKAISPEDQGAVEKWEAFFNTKTPKHMMTARYLYEHLFLAHITFKTGSGQFYEIVRSTTPPGEAIDIIATVRPYDPPGADKFFYRFRKIHSTIVHKTHMVFPLDEYQYNRFTELFIDTKWVKEPHVVSYDTILSANPFAAFEQIPPKSRYQFLLDNSNYIIMTFIRGPVCKGQVALNVIHDHFWVFFVDPEHDLTVRYPGFLQTQIDNLAMPTERESNYRLFRALRNKYSDGAIRYHEARQQLYSSFYYYIWFRLSENLLYF